MLRNIKTSVIALGFFTVVCGVAYPLGVTAIGGVFDNEAKGSLVFDSGRPVASMLVGQNFSKSEYFHPRPSAAGEKGYDGTSSGGSNLGYTSQKLYDTVKDRAAKYREINGLDASDKVPMDAVTASASGLDPHITLQNALLQSKRVAKARSVEPSKIQEAIKECTEGKFLGIIGEEKINVVKLNLRLDKEFGKAKI
ncbi:MAG: potassium-transporting ATPase subunit KdpC [Campylobacterales bacterium]|nr:potassium-transporting ATPase subunit KdpC [Campylobacterales bacterium]